MDWQSIVIVILVVFALFWLLTRLKGGVRNPPKLRVAMELISNINDDLKIINQRQADPQLQKKFKTGNWRSYQEHLDFLDKEAIANITTSFDQMEAYNFKLAGSPVVSAADLAKPKVEISLDELKATMIKARSSLAKWIQENISRESTRGMFSWK